MAAASTRNTVGATQQISLQTLLTYRATLADSKKAASLQYSDLHGVPCLLVLCEKGRMGDTFPQTFGCLDLRIRTSDNHTTFIQEIGRLCRYPATDSSSSGSKTYQISTTVDAVANQKERLDGLKEALQFAYSGGKHVS